MKRLIVLIALVVSPLSMLFAHPASELTISYPERQFNFNIQGKHMVSTSENTDKKQHFIKTVSISINGRKAKVANVASQTGDTFNADFKLDLPKGTKVVVTVTCSLGGEKTTEFIVK